MPPDRVRQLELRIEELSRLLQDRNIKITAQQNDIDVLERELKDAHEEIAEITQPPWSMSHFVRLVDKEQRLIEVAGEKIIHCLKKSMLNKANIDLANLRTGQKVWLAGKDNVLVHVEPCEENKNLGEVWTFQSLGENGLLVVRNHNATQTVIAANQLETTALKLGDSLLVKAGMAMSKIDVANESQKFLEAGKPTKRFSMIGGLDDEIRKIRERIIVPFLDPEGARRFKLDVATADDFVQCTLLHGPPGCGKGLLAEATCAEILERCAERFGPDFKVGFIMVRGSELLDKFVGNTEGMMRELLLQKTADFDLSVVFWDEFGAMFPPRGMHTNAPWIASHVAQFNSLIGSFRAKKRKLILFAADNRIREIDPAILRAGRFSIKIHIPRPNEIGAQKILPIYLTPDIPLHPSCFTRQGQSPEEVIQEFTSKFLRVVYDPDSEANRLIEVKYEGGKDVLGFKDLIVSGAVFHEIIVESAKTAAYNRWENSGNDPDKMGLVFKDLTDALEEQIEETDHMPTAEKALDDWLKTEGIEGGYVAKFLRKETEGTIGFQPKS